MKVAYLAIGILSLLTPLTAAWSKEDREIFRIRDEIAAHESDPAATFYNILGVSPSASLDDINKAYRLKSRSLHPDKVKQKLRADKAKAGNGKKGSGSHVAKGPSQSETQKAVKEASERQARLSLIANILRGPSRDRYDHFLSNGFPLWKGTDYYYNRYRPGLGTVMVGLFLVGGGAFHYLILYMNWKRQREFVDRYVRFARSTAWGGNIPGFDAAPTPPPAPVPVPEEEEGGPPQPMNRKQRRMQERESRKEEGKAVPKKARKAPVSSKNSSREPSAGPAGARKRVVAENGKILVVDSQGDVFLEEQDEEGNVNEYLLDPNELARPTLKDTAVIRVPIWFFHLTVGRFLSKGTTDAEYVEQADAEEDSDVPQHTPSSDSAGEDFELLDGSLDSLNKVKTTGAQQAGKANKRKGKKR